MGLEGVMDIGWHENTSFVLWKLHGSLLNLPKSLFMEFDVKVEGMTCGHCKMAVERIIREEGAEEFQVDLGSGNAHIVSSEATLQKIIHEINETGIYKAQQA